MSPDPLDRLCARQPHTNVYEDLIAGLAGDVLRPGDLAVDGGAHRGLHSWPMALQVGPQGRVLAIEPVPALAQGLRLAALARGLGQVTVIEAALAERAGEAEFLRVRNADAHGGLRPRPYAQETEIERIAVRTLRLEGAVDAAAQWPWRFARLDLAGGEYHALLGAPAAIARWRPVLVFGSGGATAAEAYGYSAAEFFGFFARIDYRLLDLFGRPFGPAHWEVRPMPSHLVALPEGPAGPGRVARHLADRAVRVAQALG